MSATAERDGVSLIAVIMAAPTRDARNSAAAALLDYGFASYETYQSAGATLTRPLLGGDKDCAELTYPAFCKTVPKGSAARVTMTVELPAHLTAPLEAGAPVGRVVYTLDGQFLGEVPITATNPAPQIRFATLFLRLLRAFLLC